MAGTGKNWVNYGRDARQAHAAKAQANGGTTPALEGGEEPLSLKEETAEAREPQAGQPVPMKKRRPLGEGDSSTRGSRKGRGAVRPSRSSRR